MIRPLICILLFVSWERLAQRTIRGQVVNGETEEPLPFSTIFLANTTKGTTADGHGRFILTNVQPGRYDMVVSFVGYETFAFPVQADSARTYKVRLKPMANQLAEVHVKAKRDAEWEEHLQFFKKNFIGSSEHAKDCRLLNPEVLWFDFKPDIPFLTAGAREALKIENKALGYTITYLLESFTFDYRHHYLTYMGYPVLQEMKARNQRQQKRWETNRQKAFYGSPMHFMRSVHERRLGEEGFELRRIIEKEDTIRMSGMPVRTKKTRMLIRTPLPNDYLVLADSSDAGHSVLKFSDIIQVTYTKENESQEYLRAQNPFSQQSGRGGPQSSVIQLKGPVIRVEPNGNYYEPLDILFEGYWSWEKVAELLPLSYKP